MPRSRSGSRSRSHRRCARSTSGCAPPAPAESSATAEEEVEHQREDHAQQQACHQGDEDLDVAAPEGDVSGEAAQEGNTATEGEEDADDEQERARDDQEPADVPHAAHANRGRAATAFTGLEAAPADSLLDLGTLQPGDPDAVDHGQRNVLDVYLQAAEVAPVELAVGADVLLEFDALLGQQLLDPPAVLAVGPGVDDDFHLPAISPCAPALIPIRSQETTSVTLEPLPLTVARCLQ